MATKRKKHSSTTKRKTTLRSPQRGNRRVITRKNPNRVLMLFRNDKPMFSPSTGDPFMSSPSEAKTTKNFFQKAYPKDDFVIIESSKAHANKFRR